ncbi:MAG TPA: protein translocase subunit SecF [Acidimicrobiales bacterium]|nr:protein translocase subunit SecF [Acidimicrobiales bacterium]
MSADDEPREGDEAEAVADEMAESDDGATIDDTVDAGVDGEGADGTSLDADDEADVPAHADGLVGEAGSDEGEFGESDESDEGGSDEGDDAEGDDAEGEGDEGDEGDEGEGDESDDAGGDDDTSDAAESRRKRRAARAPRPPRQRPARARNGFFHRLYSFDANIDFKKGWKVAAVLSTLMVVISIGSLFVRELNLGIDFRGGIAWQFPGGDASTSQIRKAATDAGAKDPQVQRLGTSDFRVEVPPASSDAAKAAYEGKISTALAKASGQPLSVVEANLNEVGPTWGSDVSSKAIKALIFFLIAIFIYVWIRLEWKFAISAIAAVIHDVIVAVGVYSILRFEVTPATVIAFLTILGYSLYDTIVVYDKIRENQGRVTANGTMTYTDMCNLSANQTFMRSINTTLSAVIPVLSILIIGAWVMGAVTLEEFGLALLVGLISGAYSSIFIAAPMTAWIKEREPKYAEIRQRLSRLSDEERAEGLAAGSAARREAVVVGAGAGAGGARGEGRRAGGRVAAAGGASGSAPAGGSDGDLVGGAGADTRRRGAVPPRPSGTRSAGASITPRPRKHTPDRRKKK